MSNIFQYYLDLAQKRRNQLLTSEKMITKDLRALSHEEISHNNNSSSSLIVQYHLQQIDYYKELIRVNKDLISYKEFIQVISFFFFFTFFFVSFHSNLFVFSFSFVMILI